MASLSGPLHRPLSAAAVVAVAAVSSDLPDRFSHHKLSESNAALSPTTMDSAEPFRPASVTGLSGLSVLSRDRKPIGDASCGAKNVNLPSAPGSFYRSFSASIAPPPAIHTLYQYARLIKPQDYEEGMPTIPSSSSDVLYRWHLPDPRTCVLQRNDGCSSAKSQTVVVLLGWLGAKQKNLKRYADWYTSRGFHAVTFTFPMSDIISYNTGGKAEQDLESLANHLAGWVAEESGKNLIFHTFSNTGWLTYGAILEKFQKQDSSVMEKIRGCIVDSAPVAAPDPQVWASGFSAAFLKKQSITTKGMMDSKDLRKGMVAVVDSGVESKPAVTETALLVVLEKFFEVVLNLPAINRRLLDVLDLLSSEQPKCPQFYIYSSADRVIPAKSVESFIEKQRRVGHEVKACNFVSSPHVDHFRSHPALYTTELTSFLDDCVLTCCKDSS
ncbi:uncharacterized protein [Typha angustifolia]|uniref:uncharacterized protein n=1 Tax=Typha angustifolia TaxID=59011 RepID=UPI003C2C9A74